MYISKVGLKKFIKNSHFKEVPKNPYVVGNIFLLTYLHFVQWHVCNVP